jgi:ABC-type branched-subunit amino acid transport system ATPase component
MLRTLRITSFRGLREFAMSGLGRVNLLVGTNNCGKTSVLEAIHILSAVGSSAPLWQAQLRRGELIDSATERQVDVAHVVHGHKLPARGGFIVAGDSDTGAQSVHASFIAREFSRKDDEGDDDDGDDVSSVAPMWLELIWSARSPDVRMPITRRGGMRDKPVLTGDDDLVTTRGSVLFIATEGLTRDNVVSMFESVVLTPDEQTVLQALRTIEPTIERIASVGTYKKQSSRDARGGLAMMVAGQRIPIGSMGDGIWRLLGIALALVRARGGVLLVDEIDTGLHYSVLVDMWKLVLATARSLDVQVFATTHSRDCYEALAAVTEDGRDEISLQRIERGKVEAIGFTEAEIRQAAERGLEVR